MENYLKTTDIDWLKHRLTSMFICFLCAFVLLLIRLFYLQILQGPELRRLSETNRIRIESIPAPRGTIFDRTRKLIVENRPSFDLSIVLKDARPLKETISKIAECLNTPQDALMERIKKSNGMAAYRPVLLKKDIGREALAAIEVHRFELPGIVVTVNPIRHYIQNNFASHLLGYMGEINAAELKMKKYKGYRAGDYIGKFGIEKTFEKYLRGKRGKQQVEVNVNGQVVRVLNTVNAIPGNNLFLTIDHELQKKAEECLEGIVGAVVAMDPENGKILCMASSPTFNQNDFVKGMSHEQWRSLVSNPFRPLENKAIQGEYPPGSTYKIITAMAGLEEGGIDENSTVYCPGFYKYGDRVFRCWKRGGHGSCDVKRAIEESCDVFFYQVGQRLGVDRLSWYAKASGLGTLTGIALDHEAEGLIPNSTWKKLKTGIAWQGGETLSVAIGQGYDLCTPIQMLEMISAVANGGTLYKPLIIDRIETSYGNVVRQGERQVVGRLPVKMKSLELIQAGLWGVVNSRKGTARIARLENIDVCGKTGTSQVIGRGVNDNISDRATHLQAHAWFVAYAPAEKPRIAVSVIIEHGEHGSSAAAPVAREVIRTYMKEVGNKSE